jgi:hypothetical protein
MSEKTFVTRTQWMPGVHFIFASVGRSLEDQEVAELCVRYFGMHQNVTYVNEALFVDLRPAFSVPLSEITPETFLRVPINYTPPSR